MKYFLIPLFILGPLCHTYSQEIDSTSVVNSLFEWQLDSIEQRIIETKQGIDTDYYLHYTVKNISEDTLTYVCNSCFYYNHYYVRVNDLAFPVNLWGGCYFNEVTPFELPPGKSFSRTEPIITYGLDTLELGHAEVTLFIPLVKDQENLYRVDGRLIDIERMYLVGKGTTKVV
ncbi:MAG: hypothetical protein AAF587_27365 [Bacteroidota bacterium]